MQLLVNDLSLHGQFLDLASFKYAISQLMMIRETAHQFGWNLYCHRGMRHAFVMPEVTMPQAIQALTCDERRALLSWITQTGPFWEDARQHSSEEWLEWNGNIVTDTAVGEVAWCRLNGINRALISFTLSQWQFSPVSVDWISNTNVRKSIDVVNHWNPVDVKAFFQAMPTPILTWDQLKDVAIARCDQLTFARDAFSHLEGHPFSSSAAERLLFIFDTLNRYKSCFDKSGERTLEGNEIYQNFFTGKKEGGGRGALFTDSSPSEKDKYAQEMTFKHPTDFNRTIFCPWHGKVQTPQLRVHFSSPIRAEESLYIMYVGPKITKR